jgi:hypothetical protein
MQTIHAIAFGMFVLIFLYLAVKNADGFTGILKSGFSGINTLATTLQGR